MEINVLKFFIKTDGYYNDIINEVITEPLSIIEKSFSVEIFVSIEGTNEEISLLTSPKRKNLQVPIFKKDNEENENTTNTEKNYIIIDTEKYIIINTQEFELNVTQENNNSSRNYRLSSNITLDLSNMADHDHVFLIPTEFKIALSNVEKEFTIDRSNVDKKIEPIRIFKKDAEVPMLKILNIYTGLGRERKGIFVRPRIDKDNYPGALAFPGEQMAKIILGCKGGEGGHPIYNPDIKLTVTFYSNDDLDIQNLQRILSGEDGELGVTLKDKNGEKVNIPIESITATQDESDSPVVGQKFLMHTIQLNIKEDLLDRLSHLEQKFTLEFVSSSKRWESLEFPKEISLLIRKQPSYTCLQAVNDILVELRDNILQQNDVLSAVNQTLTSLINISKSIKDTMPSSPFYFDSYYEKIGKYLGKIVFHQLNPFNTIKIVNNEKDNKKFEIQVNRNLNNRKVTRNALNNSYVYNIKVYPSELIDQASLNVVQINKNEGVAEFLLKNENNNENNFSIPLDFSSFINRENDNEENAILSRMNVLGWCAISLVFNGALEKRINKEGQSQIIINEKRINKEGQSQIIINEELENQFLFFVTFFYLDNDSIKVKKSLVNPFDLFYKMPFVLVDSSFSPLINDMLSKYYLPINEYHNSGFIDLYEGNNIDLNFLGIKFEEAWNSHPLKLRREEIFKEIFNQLYLTGIGASSDEILDAIIKGLTDLTTFVLFQNNNDLFKWSGNTEEFEKRLNQDLHS